MPEQKTPRPRKRRRSLLIAAAILLVLAALLTVVLIRQKNNIDAIVIYSKYTQEEIEDQLTENDRRVEDLLNEALEAAKEVDEALDQPEPTPTVAPEAEPETTAAPLPTAQPTAKPTQPPKPSGPTYEEQLKAIVDKIYALRSEYLLALDQLQAEATAAYKAMSAQKRTAKAVADFVSTYISRANDLEKDCDSRMKALVSELSALQKKYSQSDAIVGEVEYTYANEKSLKKAWYMSELKKRGLM